MALTILVTPQTGDTIEAATWANEFNNIYNNSLSLISPLTGTLNFNNNTLTNLALGSASAPSLYFNGDANTGIYSRTADTFNITAGSSLALEVGASWILAAAPEDSRTDSVDVVGIIRSTTSGTPAAGIGVGIAFQAESGDENPSTFGRIDFAATDVGAGTEDTYMDILLRVAGVAEETKYRFASTAGTGFQGTFTHAVTADRTWTLPDATTTIVGTDTTQILTNKEMTTIELGHATDTTISRVSAGIIAVEGVNVLLSGGALGTPSSGVATNLTGTAAGLTAGNVTTNANLTGHVTSTGNAAILGSFTLAQLNTAISDADVATGGGTATGTNTGDQTITLTGGVTGSGTGSFAATVVTNANLTGPITSTGNATAVAAQTGTGTTFVMQASPTLTTPNIGAATGTTLALGTTPATAGTFRIPSAGTIQFRNNANTANISAISKDTDDTLTFKGPQTISIDNEGTQSLVNTALQGAMIYIHTGSDDAGGLFLISGSTIAEIADPGGLYSTTSGTASSTNVTMSGGTVTIQNRRGAVRNYAVMFWVGSG